MLNVWPKRLCYALLFLTACFAVYLRLHTLGEPLEGDITTYAYVSHRLLEGASLYTDVFDHKPPGIFWAYAMAEIIFGYEPLAIFALGAFFSVVSILFLFLFLRAIASEATALVGAVFWAIGSNAHLMEANQPNAELFLNSFLFISLWAFSEYRARRGAGGWNLFLLITGAAFALATLFKMIAIFPLTAFCAYLLINPSSGASWGKRIKEVLLATLPVVLSWAGVFLYYIAVKRFDDFWEAVFVFNMEYSAQSDITYGTAQAGSGGILKNLLAYFTHPENLFHFVQWEVFALFILSALWIVLGRSSYRGLGRSFFILLAFSLMVEVASPGQFWAHYYQLYLPLLVVLSALFFYELADLIRPPRRFLAVVFYALFLAVALVSLVTPQLRYQRMSPEELSLLKYKRSMFVDSRVVGEYIESITCPSDSIYEAGAETGIYYYSKRRASARTIIINHIYVGPEEKGVARGEAIIRALKDDPPVVFVWNAMSGDIVNTAFWEIVADKYAHVRDYGLLSIYALKGRTAIDKELDCAKR